MQSIKELIEEKRTILLEGFDPVSAYGFTQVPNVILRDKKLTLGAKMTYAMLLSYAWQKESCFPGQERLAQDIGVSKRSVVSFMRELVRSGYVEKKRRGLGKTNVYIVHCQVKGKEAANR
jgi:DNA-binding MarR family transcriptional regulator